MLNKRGEINSTIVVTMIILIASLLVLLYFILELKGDEFQTDREVCGTSVSLRHSFNLGPLEGSNVIPLKCKTEKICITGSKDKCEEDFGSGKDLRVNRIKVSNPEKNRGEVKEEILDAYSEAILNCHLMLGGGELNFLPSKTFEHNYCIVCSRISLDEEVRNANFDGIDYLDLYKHMEGKRAGDTNYLDKVYGVKSVAQLEADFAILKQNIDKGEESEIDPEDVRNALDNWQFQVNNEQAILVQVVKAGNLRAKLGAGSAGGMVVTAGVGTGLLLSATGIGSFIGIPLMVTSLAVGSVYVVATAVVAGGITYSQRLPGSGDYFSPTIVPYDANSLNNLGCDSFEHLP